MGDIEDLVRQVETVRHGFKPIRGLAHRIASERSSSDVFTLARKLLGSDIHQARMLATLLLGQCSGDDDAVLHVLRDQVSMDPDWRVQEMLAMAFDGWCRDTGYERALPTIEEWLADLRATVRRAASEGLRIWTRRPYFEEHPEVAIRLLAGLRADDHEYVRRSAGNALRDISRTHRERVATELATWDLGNTRVAETHTLAARIIQL